MQAISAGDSPRLRGGVRRRGGVARRRIPRHARRLGCRCHGDPEQPGMDNTRIEVTRAVHSHWRVMSALLLRQCGDSRRGESLRRPSRFVNSCGRRAGCRTARQPVGVIPHRRDARLVSQRDTERAHSGGTHPARNARSFLLPGSFRDRATVRSRLRSGPLLLSECPFDYTRGW